MVPAFPPQSFRHRAGGLALVALVAALAAGCSSARPALPHKPQERDVMRRQGAAMIDSLVAAHGGMENWNKVVEMTFRGTDEWKGPLARFLNPWPTERAAGQNSLRLHDGRGRIAIVTDRGTLVYGLGQLGPWALLRGEPSPEPKDENSAAYLVGWHDFLVGLPWNFKEHGAVAHYLGRVHRKYQDAAQEVDEVLVTYPPEGDYWPEDWFIVRMDPNTHLMKSLTYTTTGKAPKLFETTCEFSDYLDIEGLRIPTKRVCYTNSPIESNLHTWILADVRFNQVSPDEFFERRGALPVTASELPDTTRPATMPADPSAAAGGKAIHDSARVEATTPTR
jgi:hypothetical protein